MFFPKFPKHQAATLDKQGEQALVCSIDLDQQNVLIVFRIMSSLLRSSMITMDTVMARKSCGVPCLCKILNPHLSFLKASKDFPLLDNNDNFLNIDSE